MYGEASGWSEWSDLRRTAFLLTSVGAEARRLYRAAVPADDDADLKREGSVSDDQSGAPLRFDKAVGVLKKLFASDADVRSARLEFRRLKQRQGESNVIYLANLREAVGKCSYGDLTDEMMRDAFIEGCVSDKLREKLIMTDRLTLPQLEELAAAFDRGLQRKALLQGTAKAPSTESPAAVEVAFAGRRNSTPAKRTPQQQHAGGKSGTCRACGVKGHWAKDKECRAKSQKCWKCGSVGHFGKCCPNKSKSVDAVQILSVTAQDVNAVHDVSCPYYTVTINSRPVRMLVDTGSAVSIIPARLYHQSFSSVPLRPAGLLSQWNGSGINVLGKMSVSVSGPDSQEVTSDVYVAVGQVPLLGRDLQQKLAVSVRHGNVVCQVSSKVLPAIRGYVHKVRLKPDAVPVQMPLRTMPYALREEVGKHLQDLEQQGIIERVDRSASPWLSPIVAIRKRGGKGLRICLDLSEVNKAVVPNGHPIPDMQEMLEKLRGACYMSTLDMKSAYHQLELHESSRDLTAFTHNGQTWRYRRCCFGLRSLPQCFQKLMECVLSGLPGVQVYLDDVIVTGGNRQEHDDRLQQVLRRLEDHNITLNREKCKIGVKSVDFLGFTVADGRISVSSERVQGLRNLAVPKTTKQLQAVLGSLGFYSKFVPGYSTRVEPLRRQLRKDAGGFVWTREMDAAFNDVREAILNSEALAMFDPSLPTVVTTDASDVGLGAVLSQVHPEGEKVVAFASSTLNSAQRRYSVSEREGLACVWACEKWHKYVWGQDFVLRTDHAALKSLLTAKGIGRAGMRMARWAVRLMNYSFTVEHVKGQLNPSDGLSRLPGAEQEVADDESDLVACLADQMTAVSREEIALAGQEDSEVRALIEQIPREWPRRFSDVSDVLKPYYRCKQELAIDGGLVLRGERIVVPAVLRSRLLTLAHESHQGIVRTKQRLRALFWWPAMDAAVEAAVKDCPACVAADKTVKTRFAPLNPVPLPAAAWDKVGLDFIGPMPGPQSQRYAIVLVDYYSKWPEVAFVGEPSSDAVIDFLLTVTSREGWPREVVTDNGTHFTSVKFGQFLKQYGVKHVRVSPYHPAGNGAVERLNRDIKSALQMADRESVDRRRYLQFYLRTYRATPHGTTGRSPSELLHGRQLRTALDNAVTPPAGGSTGDVPVRQRVSHRQHQMKRYFDRRKRVCAPTIQVGDWVRYRLMPCPRKGRLRFSPPCRVTARRGPVSYELEGGVRVHAERLSRCSPPANLARSARVPEGSGGDAVDLHSQPDYPASLPDSVADLPSQSDPDSAVSPDAGTRRRASVGGSSVAGDRTSKQSSDAEEPGRPRDVGGEV